MRTSITRCLEPDEDCQRTDIAARGLCTKHHRRRSRAGTLEAVPLRHALRGDTCREGHPWEVHGRINASGDLFCWTCHAGYMAARRFTLRLEAIEAYGGACVCCGEDTEAFLQFDHVENDGATHRREVGDVLAWAQRNGWPPVLQILCANCHNAKTYRGACPHEHLDH